MEKQTKKAKSFDIHYLFYDFVKATAFLPGMIFFRPKVIYADPKTKKALRHGGALVISNHIGFSDPVYLMMAIWYRRHHFVCIKHFFEKKLSAFFFGRCHCIPIDRENFSMDSFRTIVTLLKEGRVVSMFPEGHINVESNVTNQFKSGMVLMALKSEAPIVPVYFRLRKHFYNRIHVVVGEPMKVKELYDEHPCMSRIDEIAGILYQQEEALENLYDQSFKE